MTEVPSRGIFATPREALLELRVTELEAELRRRRSVPRFLDDGKLEVPDVHPHLRVAGLAQARVVPGGAITVDVRSTDVDGKGFKHGIMVAEDFLFAGDHVEIMAQLYRRCFDDLVQMAAGRARR